MGKNAKKLLLMAVGLMVAWAVLFYLLVHPLWTSRDQALATARQKLEKLEKMTKGGSDTWQVPAANASLDAEAAALKAMLAELATVQASDLGPYKLTAVGDRDPNTYFARLRREMIENVRRDSTVLLSPLIADDLGFRDKATNDPVALNLVRLYTLSRFFEAAKAVGVEEVTGLQYPDPAVMPRPEGLEIEKLIQVPIVVRLRLTEPSFGPLLYHLEPNPKHKLADRYFCIRALQAVVQDDRSGVLDVLVNLGTLFTETQLKEQGIVVKEERQRIFRPFQQPFGPQY